MAFRIQSVSVSAYRLQWKKMEHSGDVFHVISLCEIRPLDLCRVAPLYPGRAVCEFLFPFSGTCIPGLFSFLHPMPAQNQIPRKHLVFEPFRFSSLFGRMIWRAQSRMVSLEGQDERRMKENRGCWPGCRQSGSRG